MRIGDTHIGVPMYKMRRIVHVFIMVEYEHGAPADMGNTVKKGDVCRIVHWKGRSERGIKAAARRAYPGATLSFGEAWWSAAR